MATPVRRPNPDDPIRDELAPAAVLAAHGPSVWALCRRLDPDPDDAYQDVWEHILPRLVRYDPARGALRSWILSIAHRRLVDRHRRRKVRVAQPFTEVADPTPGADAVLDRRRRAERLEAALQALPESQRRVVVAHHVHGRSLDDIAADEEIAMGTVKSRLHRGRARLAQLLGRSP